MKAQKQKNEFTHDGTTAIVDISTKRHPEARMLIDLADWLAVLETGIGRVSCWRAKDRHTDYARARLDGKVVRIHRLLMPNSKMVDHISRDGIDNRRVNIRASTNSENLRNQRKYKGNTSGTTGVSWDKRSQRWRACINFNGKPRHLGYFAEKSEAITARRVAEVEHGYTCD
jgi:hypothetical protein